MGDTFGVEISQAGNNFVELVFRLLSKRDCVFNNLVKISILELSGKKSEEFRYDKQNARCYP